LVYPKRNLNYATPGSTTELSPTMSHKLVANPVTQVSRPRARHYFEVYTRAHMPKAKQTSRCWIILHKQGALMLVGLAAIAITTPIYIGRQINLKFIA